MSATETEPEGLSTSAGAGSIPLAASRDGPATLVCALGGGLLASVLAAYQAAGIGTTLGGLAVVATWTVIARVRDRSIERREGIVLAAMVLLSLVPTLRASEWLHAYAGASFLLLMATLPWIARATSTQISVVGSGLALFGGVRAAAGGSISMAKNELDGATLKQRLKAPLIGLACGLPIAAVFFALFAQADAVFASVAERALSALGGRGYGHIALAIVIGWIVAGMAYAAHRGSNARDFDRKPLTLRPREVLWGVIVVNALFALFLVVQAVQVAGFADALALPGVTYSSVAREGFFQLLAVVALVFGVVLVAQWLVGEDRHVKIALSLLLALTLGVAASALWRMYLYVTEAYGLTELRFHASACMFWLVAMLVWTQRTVVVGSRERFVPGVVGSAVAGILLLTAINPDGVIARANIENRGSRLDTHHLAVLSDDAMPVIADSGIACGVVKERSELVKEELKLSSVLSWSLAKQRAGNARCP